SKSLGGSFFYFVSSARFIRGFVQQPNPHLKPAADWIGAAVWLVVPALVLVGAGIVFLRRSWRIGEDSLPVALAMVLFATFGLVMVAIQLTADAAVLQFSYYASLLLPLAFLALAAQWKLLPGGRAYWQIVAVLLAG